MIDSSIYLEKILQNFRFNKAKSYLKGDVLDFGGNEEEFKNYVKGKYLAVNYDHSVMENLHFDTIVTLAVLEHINIKEVYEIFKKFKITLNQEGLIFLTTPTKMAKPVLEFWAKIGIVDKQNIEEHKHYWSKKNIYSLADATGFIVDKYKKFQFGFNQLAVFKHK